jgi:hypothetical protein
MKLLFEIASSLSPIINVKFSFDSASLYKEICTKIKELIESIEDQKNQRPIASISQDGEIEEENLLEHGNENLLEQ